MSIIKGKHKNERHQNCLVGVSHNPKLHWFRKCRNSNCRLNNVFRVRMRNRNAKVFKGKPRRECLLAIHNMLRKIIVNFSRKHK